MSAEITEIGAFRLTERGQLRDSFFAQIRPRVYPKLNPWVKHLTGQRFEQLKAEGLPFPAAAQAFFSWAAAGPAVFCSWSDSDLQPLRNNLAFYGLPQKLPEYCLDVQHLFHVFVGAERQLALAAAVKQSGIEPESGETFHNASGDAYYTALILQKLLAGMRAESPAADPVKTLLSCYSWNPNLTYLKRQTIRFGQGPEELTDLLKKLPIRCPACNKILRAKPEPDGGPAESPAEGRRANSAKQDPAKRDPAKRDPAKQDPAKRDPAKQDLAKRDLNILQQLPERAGGWKKKKKYYVAKATCPDHGRVSGRVSFGLVAGRIPEVQLRFQLAKYQG